VREDDPHAGVNYLGRLLMWLLAGMILATYYLMPRTTEWGFWFFLFVALLLSGAISRER
jgi:hypothetical protein